jgi:uncharacterized membrane protein
MNRVLAFLRDATERTEAVPIRERRIVLGIAIASSLTFLVLSWMRYASYHDTTYDLAIYARMCWGRAHGSSWEPIVNASVYGLHLVWFFELLGWIARLFGAVPSVLVTQSLAVGFAVVPLSRIGARHLGPSGAWAAALAFVLHPNVAAVACDEFHPGTVAVLALAWATDAVDRRNGRAVLLASLGIALCREDLALVGALASASVARRTTGIDRRFAVGSAVVHAAYVAVFVFVLHPIFAPAAGSLEAHFGGHGASVVEVAIDLATHPVALAEHLASEQRWLYPLVICAPLALLPLLAPEGLLIASPVLAIALLSDFPTTTCLDSHYLTPAMPWLVRAAVIGSTRVRAMASLRAAPLLAASVVSHVVGGSTPLSLRFDGAAFADDARSIAMRSVAEPIPPAASIQAPDALLAHLAERRTLHRAPPPEMRSAFVVLDLAHRRRFRHHEELVRTDEEPIARDWLSRDDHALVAAFGDFVLLERGLDPREGIDVERYLVGVSEVPDASATLTACLGLDEAHRDDDGITFTFVARAACNDDLALRIGTGRRPRRVDLIAEGLFSPAHFRRGDRIRSRHVLSSIEREAIARDGLRIGAIRASGARPAHEDPLSIEVTLGD